MRRYAGGVVISSNSCVQLGNPGWALHAVDRLCCKNCPSGKKVVDSQLRVSCLIVNEFLERLIRRKDAKNAGRRKELVISQSLQSV